MKIPEDCENLSQDKFELGMARLEKRTLMTFISHLYRQEERRYNLFSEKQEEYVPDEMLL